MRRLARLLTIFFVALRFGLDELALAGNPHGRVARTTRLLFRYRRLEGGRAVWLC